MREPPNSPSPLIHDDDSQALLTIERDVGMALRLSLEAVISAPLPEQITILLLRLALVESVRMSIKAETERERAVARESVSREANLPWPEVVTPGGCRG
jgi:hypothetical protein